ncbi:MAG: glycosyltransferase family 1 protein [Bradyrhizobium sp.]|nr:MAG: glycosyltransferase family 1 protein [Bradyrhizobium sp.]
MQRELIPQPVSYSAPWDAETVESRAAELLHGKSARVAYLYGRLDTSTFRYRVYNMVEALRAAPDSGVTASWFALCEADVLMRLLPQIDVLVIARLQYDYQVANLIARARTLRVRVLADFDDLVFDVRYAHLLSANNDCDTTVEEHWQRVFAAFGRMQASLSLCDGGITTNGFLAEKMAGVVDGPVRIVPNFLNRRQQELSGRLLEAKQARNFAGDGRVTIGYFSGSATHNLDFETALTALVELMREDRSVDLRIVGHMRAFDSLTEFANRVEWIDLQDWVNLQIKIAEVEINIAPLQQNDFTNCKSELKFFEAAAVGVWTCASRTFAFDAAIADPAHGRLTENSDWSAALREAVALARDKAAYSERARTTARYALDRYGWDRNTSAIVGALQTSNRLSDNAFAG